MPVNPLSAQLQAEQQKTLLQEQEEEQYLARSARSSKERQREQAPDNFPLASSARRPPLGCSIKFYYGDMAFWRAEVCRLALHLGNVPFEVLSLSLSLSIPPSLPPSLPLSL